MRCHAPEVCTRCEYDLRANPCASRHSVLPLICWCFCAHRNEPFHDARCELAECAARRDLNKLTKCQRSFIDLWMCRGWYLSPKTGECALSSGGWCGECAPKT